ASRELTFVIAGLLSEASKYVVPRFGRVSESVFVDDLFRHFAIAQIFLRRVFPPAERLMKSLGRIVDHFEQIVFVAVARRSSFARQRDADARGDMLDRFRKCEAFREREELEDVAAGAAAETIEE